jgi:hypothetical protein
MSQHTCPRCSAPIQIGQQACNVCSLPLDPARLQAFFNWQRQQAQPPQQQADLNRIIFQSHWPALTFTLYPNRIEVTEGLTRGALGGKRETILLRSVTDVSVRGMVKKLYIAANDGRRREFQLGHENERARSAILSVLASTA